VLVTNLNYLTIFHKTISFTERITSILHTLLVRGSANIQMPLYTRGYTLLDKRYLSLGLSVSSPALYSSRARASAAIYPSKAHHPKLELYVCEPFVSMDPFTFMGRSLLWVLLTDIARHHGLVFGRHQIQECATRKQG